MIDSMKLSLIFKALTADTRIRIIQLLKRHALCVSALAGRLHITQGAVSQHLRVLRSVDIVVPEKRGYYVHYRLNEKALAQWKKAIERLLDIEEDMRQERLSARTMRRDAQRRSSKAELRERGAFASGHTTPCPHAHNKKCTHGVRRHPVADMALDGEKGT